MKIIKLIQGNIEYELGGSTGSWAKSIECNVKKGDVRFIGRKLMYAYTIYKKPGIFDVNAPEVNWVPVDEKESCDFDKMKNWVNNVD